MDFVRIVVHSAAAGGTMSDGLLAGGMAMPELPEVETMVRGLRPALLGRRLRRLEVLDPSLVQGCSARRNWRGTAGVRRSTRWVGGASGSS